MNSEMSGRVGSDRGAVETETNTHTHVHLTVQCTWCCSFGAICIRTEPDRSMMMKCVSCGNIWIDGK